jgi:hypothetical protein
MMRELEQSYNDISEAFRTYMENALAETVVTLEEAMIFSPEQSPWVGIYLSRRDPAREQFLRAGARVDYVLRYSIWCWAFNFEPKQAAFLRNEIAAAVEAAVLANPTIDGYVETSFIEGGDMIPAAEIEGSEPRAWTAGAEVLVAVRNPIILKREE